MGEVIQFPAKDDPIDIDLVTALDVAVRDLRDIVKQCRGDTRKQAEECLRMLRAALNAAPHWTPSEAVKTVAPRRHEGAAGEGELTNH